MWVLGPPQVVQTDYMPFDPTVKRTEGTIKLPSGEAFKATKGAPHILLQLIDDEDIKKVSLLLPQVQWRGL